MVPHFDRPPLFVFDLDSTVTQGELLPLLAREMGFEDEMRRRTECAMRGGTSFAQDFPARVKLLTALPVTRAQEIAAKMPLNPIIATFLRMNASRCRIMTGNLDVWIAPLMEQLHMSERCYASRARLNNGKVTEVAFVLDKGTAARSLAHPFIAIGDGDNDVEMIRAADLGIAFGGVREPAATLLAEADLRFDDERALIDFLNQFI